MTKRSDARDPIVDEVRTFWSERSGREISYEEAEEISDRMYEIGISHLIFSVSD